MLIAVPAERRPFEARIAATPETVKKMVAAGHSVRIERGAGEGSRLPDELFAAVGAAIADSFAATVADADLVLKVQAPTAEELAQLPKSCALLALCSPYTNPLLADYAGHGLAALALELIPRTSRAQSMDVLSSQANIAGYKAVLLACEHYRRFFPMLMTAAGTVTPAKVLIVGAGVAGLQAIATARRLGALVEAFDVRTAAKEQVESLGAKFVEVPVAAEGEGAGGYAREMSEEYKQKQSELLHRHAANADIVITTALIPGRPAPRLIPAETVAAMRPGSVIVDLAVEMGGNTEGAKSGEVVQIGGVTIVGHPNIPSLLATDAASLYARNIWNLLGLLLPKGAEALSFEDEIVQAALLCKGGEMLKPQLLQTQSGGR